MNKIKNVNFHPNFYNPLYDFMKKLHHSYKSSFGEKFSSEST
jgi:hypothetical protein